MIRNTTKLQKFGWVLFILYLIALTYFLFFAEIYRFLWILYIVDNFQFMWIMWIKKEPWNFS